MSHSASSPVDFHTRHVPALVLNEGTILHVDLERYDDPGLDAALEADGVSLATAAYRPSLVAR